jgi:hypothetical protein
MNGIIISTTFFSVILTILVLVIRGVSQVRKLSLSNIFFILIYGGLLYLGSGLVIDRYFISSINTEFIYKTSLVLISFSFVAVASICVISEPTPRKLKTLLRLPIIGFLLGWYMESYQIVWLLLAVELMQLAIFYKNKEQFNYCFRQEIKGLFGLALATCAYFYKIELFYLGFVLFLIMKFQILNATKLKIIVYENNIEE